MQPTTAPVANNTRTSIVAHSPAGRQLLEALAAIEAVMDDFGMLVEVQQ